MTTHFPILTHPQASRIQTVTKAATSVEVFVYLVLSMAVFALSSTGCNSPADTENGQANENNRAKEPAAVKPRKPVDKDAEAKAWATQLGQPNFRDRQTAVNGLINLAAR